MGGERAGERERRARASESERVREGGGDVSFFSCSSGGSSSPPPPLALACFFSTRTHWDARDTAFVTLFFPPASDSATRDQCESVETKNRREQRVDRGGIGSAQSPTQASGG